MHFSQKGADWLGIVPLDLHPLHFALILHCQGTESVLLTLLLRSAGILVPFPYFLSLFLSQPWGYLANEECPLGGWQCNASSPAVPQAWLINHGCTSREGHRSSCESCSSGAFLGNCWSLVEERPWGLIMGCQWCRGELAADLLFPVNRYTGRVCCACCRSRRIGGHKELVGFGQERLKAGKEEILLY